MAPTRNSSIQLAVLCSVLLASPAWAASGNIYKYADKDGHIHYDTAIPPEYVKLGYTILNDKGQVIQEVKRAPTPEELAKIEEAKKAEAQKVNSKQSQEEYDKVLIRLYRDPDEVVKKRDVALKQQKTQRDLARLNLTKAEEEVKRFQENVDAATKAGKEAPADIKKKLAAALASRDKNEGQLKKMDADRDKLISDSERDFKRLRELMSMPAEAIPAPPPIVEKTESAEKTATQ